MTPTAGARQRRRGPSGTRRPPATAPAACVAGVLLALVACLQPSAPDPTTAPLQDAGGVLSATQRARIVDYLGFVEQRYGIDYRVVVESPAAGTRTEVRAAELFHRLGVGDRHRGRGLLLWLDPARRQVRVEVGYALEPLVTDLDAGRMLRDYLAPHGRAAAVGPAIEAAVEALVDTLAPRLADLAAGEVATAGSGGAGAADDLRSPPPEPSSPDDPLAARAAPQPDPRAARDLEIALLHRGLYLQSSRLYDADWRRADRPARWTPERLRQLGREWDRPYEVVRDGGFAVAYYPDAPALGPTFLRREPEGWVIDATATARIVVYDFSNRWWFALDEPSPYLALLRGALPLHPVRLQSGRAAWAAGPAPPPP